MAPVRGIDCKLYLNGETYESPSWKEMANVTNLNITQPRATADATTRATDVDQMVATTRAFTMSFDAVYDSTDTALAALETAYYAAKTVDIMTLDKARTTVGAKGQRATCYVTNFSSSEDNKDVKKVSIELTNAYSKHVPEQVEIAS